MVFAAARPTPEERYDVLVDLISGVNIDYSSDRETFTRATKGRGMLEIFANIELGRMFYDHIEHAMPGEAFIPHQRAVFEMNHPGGDLNQAQAVAKRAYSLHPDSHCIRTTQGEISIRLVNQTSDPLLKQVLRRGTREKVAGDLGPMSAYDFFTRARLAIDEFRDELRAIDPSSDDKAPASFLEAAKYAEEAIQKGMQRFPESPELLSAEATYRNLTGEKGVAIRALERAFNANRRQDWIAVRLSRSYEAESSREKSREVLESCLAHNSQSKVLHLEYALLLKKLNGDPSRIMEHLKRSFSEGDNNFEAQFCCGRELFLQNRFDEAKTLFRNIHRRAPGRFRNQATEAVLDGEDLPVVLSGSVERMEEGYAFLKAPQFPEPIFALRGDCDQEYWHLINLRSTVSFQIAFCRRGVRAINMKPT